MPGLMDHAYFKTLVFAMAGLLLTAQLFKNTRGRGGRINSHRTVVFGALIIAVAELLVTAQFLYITCCGLG